MIIQKICSNKITWFLLFLPCFVQLRVLVGFLSGSMKVGWAIDLGLSLFFIIISFFITKIKGLNSFVLITFLVILFEVLYFLILGTNWRFFLNYISLIPLFFMSKYFVEEINISYEQLVSFILLANSIHIIFVIAKLLFPFMEVVNNVTSYGYSNPAFMYRGTGAFVSPGYLVFYVSIIMVYSWFDYLKKKNLLQFINFFLTFLLGLATLNKSFFVTILFVCIVTPFFVACIKNLKSVIIFVVFFAFFAALLQIFSISLFEIELLNYSLEKFSKSFDDRLIGNSGLLFVLADFRIENIIIPFAKYEPLINAPIVQGRSLSNSYVSQFATKGLLLALLLFVLYFVSFWKLIFFTEISSEKLSGALNHKALAAAFFSGLLVCMFENLLLSPLMLLIVIYSVSLSREPKCQS